MREERGSWYLLTGLLIGVALGLFYAWRIRPVNYTNTSPASLRSDFKDQYRSMIAVAYLSNGDLVRAKARLELLQDPDVYKTMAEQAQRMLAQGSSGEEARALGLLVVELGQVPATLSTSIQTSQPALQETPVPSTVPPSESATIPTATITNTTVLTETVLTDTVPTTFAIGDSVSVEITPTVMLAEAVPSEIPTQLPASTATSPAVEVTLTAAATITPLPTRTPTPTPGIAYVLQSRDLVCDQALGGPMIQVQILDAAGGQVPGVEVVVSWDGGEDQFFTGLKPELGLGIADFSMEPDIQYTLRLVEGGQPVPEMAANECETDAGERFWGTWKLVFTRP